MKILILISSLHIGGAERHAIVAAKGLQAKGHSVSLVVLYPGGELESQLDSVPLISLNKRGRWDVVGVMLRLAKLIKQTKTEVIYSFLGTSNIITALLKPLFPSTKLAWAILSSEMQLDNYGWATHFSYWLEAKLSFLPDIIISNSHAGQEYAEKQGFPPRAMEVAENGTDIHVFKPDQAMREQIRKEWGISPNQFLVGLPARIDPIKGHEIFLKAAQIVAQEIKDAVFVCIGGGSSDLQTSLMEQAKKLGIESKIIWTGPRQDMPAVYNGLDLACLSSHGEGSPTVILEAMSSGTPCAATNAGDAAILIGETGISVPIRDYSALAEAIISMRHRIEMEPNLSSFCRKRIVDEFSLNAMLEKTEQLLLKALSS